MYFIGVVIAFSCLPEGHLGMVVIDECAQVSGWCHVSPPPPLLLSSCFLCSFVLCFFLFVFFWGGGGGARARGCFDICCTLTNNCLYSKMGAGQLG